MFAPDDESRQKGPWHKDHDDLEDKDFQGHRLVHEIIGYFIIATRKQSHLKAEKLQNNHTN